MDQQYWDDRYRTKEQLWSGAPNGLLVAEATDLPPGQALDIGCGEGGDAKVSWTYADLTVSAPPAASFDLVSALYFPLPRTSDHRALHSILAAVAPGGTLLFGGHDLRDIDPEQMDIDPHAFYRPDEVADLLDDTWTILANEIRPRVSPAPPASGHTNDTVLKARKNA